LAPNTRAGDVVIQASNAAPSVFLVGRVLNDGDLFGTDQVEVVGKRQALAKAVELLIDGHQIYQVFDSDNWNQESPKI